MRIITVLSADYLEMTELFLESLRVWHPHVPVVCYAIPDGWRPEAEKQLERFDVSIELLCNDPPRKLRKAWKLEALAKQTEPVVLMDVDMLVLRPIDLVFKTVQKEGWFTVFEGTKLRAYYQGEIQKHLELTDTELDVRTFNTGLVGYDPNHYGHVISTAYHYAESIDKIWGIGDQALTNLAYYSHHRQMPSGHSFLYNGGWNVVSNGIRFNLAQAVMHFTGPAFPPRGLGYVESKLSKMRDIWSKWPTGLPLQPFSETMVWKDSLPHPWSWLNQCTQSQYREAVRRIRQASLALHGQEGIVIESAYEAYLLDPGVRKWLSQYWKHQGKRFQGLPHHATFHLRTGGRSRSPIAQTWDLAQLQTMALIR